MPNKVGTIYNTRFGRLTNDELLSKLKEAYKLLGHPISKNDLRKLKDFGYPSLYENRFGSWSKAIILANIPPVTKKDARRRSAKTRVIKYNPKKLFPCLTLRFKVLNRDNFTCQYCGRTPQYRTCNRPHNSKI